ncbi:MAG: septum site-determining protein MinD [Ruminococcus sp.]|nr:septum site-determining protein MinD [Ruminococcus sp.]
MNNVIVVASGKGGTGKSTVCICLSVALVRQGKKVLLIDCDCGMRGLDIMLDIEQDILFDASDAVCGNCSFGEAVYKSKNNDNLFLMAAPFDAENELSPSVFRQLVASVRQNFDYVIIDSPAGIGSGFVTACAPADRALIVTNAEPTGVRGAVKVRTRLEALGIADVRLVINRFDKRLFRRLGFYADLDAVIDASQTQLIALVPFDLNISVVMQQGAASAAGGAVFPPFERLARRVEGERCPLVLKGML